jgi:hypothetical protein
LLFPPFFKARIQSSTSPLKGNPADILRLLCLVGWTIPWIWAGIWAVITTYWVKSALMKEKLTWSESQMASLA